MDTHNQKVASFIGIFEVTVKKAAIKNCVLQRNSGASTPYTLAKKSEGSPVPYCKN
jgi:hypothetical protein